MIEVIRPNVFSECATCPIAAREIRDNSKQDTDAIKIECFRVNLLFWRDITMLVHVLTINQKFGKISNESFVTEKKYANVVTESCPGFAAEKSAK